MSRQKVTDSEQGFDAVMARAMTALNAKTQRELAESLGMSTGDFANRKKRGALPHDRLISLASSRNVSLDWLLTGRGNMHLQSDDRPAHEDHPLSPRMKALIDMYQTLSDKDQDEILRDAEEKKRMREMERQIQELSSRVEALKKSG